MRTLRAAALWAAISLPFISSPSEAIWPFNGAPICTAIDYQRLARICGDGSGGAIIVWQDSRNGANPDIYAQRVDAGGVVQWAANGVPVCTTTGSQMNCEVVPDGSGGAIVVWPDYRAGSVSDIYAQRIDGTGTAMWTTNGEVVCNASGSQYGLGVIADGSGGAVVAWVDLRSTNDGIYAQRIDATGATQWTADGVPVCIAAGAQAFPLIVSTPTVGAVIAWDDQRNGDHDIYAQRLDDSGVPQWTTDGDTVCTASGDQRFACIDGEGSGGLFAAWADERGADTDIYAQRLNGSGIPQWTGDGVVVCGASDDQQNPAIKVELFGNTVVAWQDARGANVDIYAQRLTNSGSGMWVANGVVVCDFLGTQAFPDLVHVAGGTVIAWTDRRNGGGNDDIYAQKIDMLGVQQWRPYSVVVTGAPRMQLDFRLIPDGGSGALISWMDSRNGVDVDIYAHHITDALAVGTEAEVPAPRGLTLLGNGPNPFGTETTIRFSLSDRADVRLEVYDVRGRRVYVHSYSELNAGLQSLRYGGRDQKGRDLPSGVYVYRITAAGLARESKMTITR